MKKNKKIKRIPSYKFGANEISNVISGIGQFTSQAVQANNQEKADPLGGALSGMSAGASIGSFAGPIGSGIGAGIGAIGGAIMGMIGNKGSVDPITGEITYGSGFKGNRGLSDEELEQMSGMITNMNELRKMSPQIAQKYYNTHGVNDVTMKNGGISNTTLAYLDDGELLRTPDGSIVEVPEEGKPTDSNLANVPVGTQVLSDKLKVPGTKKTFAQMGKSIMKNRKYGNDVYAQNSKKLNDINNQIAYDELLALQENMKTKKNGKKRGIQKAALGDMNLDELTPWYTGRFSSQNIGTSFKPDTKTTTQLVYEDIKNSKNNGSISSNFMKFLPHIGSLTSSILTARENLRDTTPEYVSTYSYSPQFVPVDYNIEPLLNEINRSDAIARYNNRNIGGGASLAQGVQLAVARDKAISEAYNMKRNAENNIRATNANIYNQWGQFDANARKVAATENAQNRAAARNIRRQGISQLGTIVPSFIKDLRLENRDKAMFNAMLPYLGYGMTQDQISKLIKSFG